MSYVAIQLIKLEYTDDQRGRADAEKRQRIRALPLEVVAGGGVLQDCRATARDGYSPKTMTSVFAGPPAAQIFFGTPAAHHDLRHDFLHNAYR